MKVNLNQNIEFLSNVSFSDKVLFTKHLSIMIKSGITILEALEILADKASSKYFKSVLQKVVDDIRNGQALAKSLAKFPKVFDEFYISLIEISEESGSLDTNLEFLAKQLKKDYHLKKKVQSATLYPMIVLSAVSIVGGFISFFILPKLIDFFNSFEIQLPLSTRILLWIAHVMKDYGGIIILSIIGLVVVIQLLLEHPKVRLKWDRLKMKMPIFGKVIAYGQLSRFSRNLGMLLKRGVPIQRALVVTSHTLSNSFFRLRVAEIHDKHNNGQKIGEIMNNDRFNIFPPLVMKMIAVGERSGNLDESLLYLSDFFDEEIDDIYKNITIILEPMLLLGIGLVVGFVATAIITPIYDLAGAVGK